MYIIEGNNILLRQAPQACAENSHPITYLLVCSGISEIRRESFHHKTYAHAHRVDNMESFEDDQFQTSRHGRNFINDDRDAGNCTRGRSRARLAGFLPEPGGRIRTKRDRERYGIGSQRLICERASKAPVSEALRQRSQVTMPMPQPDRSRSARSCKSVPIGRKGGPTGRLCC
jgi:hypothetical protein